MCQFSKAATANNKCTDSYQTTSEDVIKVNAFDLREAFGYKPGFLTTIAFSCEYPAILYGLTAFR